MKKILLCLSLLVIQLLCNAQSLVLRSNLLSHIRPLPTANLNIGLLNKSERTEIYLSLEKAYSSFDKISIGRFQPNNKKANLEFGLGIRGYSASFLNNKLKIYVLLEMEYARLNYLCKEANKWAASGNWFFITSYDSDGVIHVNSYKFNRFQILLGLGFRISINRKLGLDLSWSLWRTSHKLGSITRQKDEFGGDKLIQEVRNLEVGLTGPLNPSELFASSDKLLDSDHKVKYGLQPGLSIYYIFGK